MFNIEPSELYNALIHLGFPEQSIILEDRNHMVRFVLGWGDVVRGNVFKIRSQLHPSRALSGQGDILSGFPY